MKSDEAGRMLDAALQEAGQVGKPVSIAILDATGLMMVFQRYKDAAGYTAVIAEAKASGSVIMGRDSAELETMAANSPGIINAMAARFNGRFTARRGALVISRDNGTYGAIGVSGATSEEDEQIARAGLAAL